MFFYDSSKFYARNFKINNILYFIWIFPLLFVSLRQDNLRTISNMTKLTIEYPLNTKSPNIVWGMISTAEGLQKWLADIVVTDGETMTFTWGHPWTDRDTKTSQILECDKFNYSR